MKYIFKYVTKGQDRAVAEVVAAEQRQGDNAPVLNEVKNFMEGR